MDSPHRHEEINPDHADVGAGKRAATAADFLTMIRCEQARFVEALRVAQASLPQHEGQLARLAALQLRLTVQFLDAQRSILTHRAQVDEEVRCILSDVGVSNSSIAGAQDTRRHGSHLDASSAPRQLTSVLDDWWCAETLDGWAAVDAARQAVRQGDVGSPSDVAEDGVNLLPVAAQVLLAEASGDEDLETLLDALAATMESAQVTDVTSSVDSPGADASEVLIRLDGAAADEQFGRFWEIESSASGHAGPALPGSRRATRWTERRMSLAWNR